MHGNLEQPIAAENTIVRLPRVTLDLKVPIWAVGSAVAGVVWALFSMYFQLMAQSQALLEVQALLKANNQTTVQMQIDIALMKQRLEKLEAHTLAK